MVSFKDPEAEEKYNLEYSDFIHKRIRDGSTWGILFYPLFALLDFAVYPDYFSFFIILRIISELVLGLGLAFSFSKSSRKFLQSIAIFQYVTLCASIIVMIHVADGYQSPYYVGLILTLLFLISIYPLSFRSTLVVTSATFLGYLIPIFIMGGIKEPIVLLTNSVFFFGVIFFLNISAYVTERMRRQEFAARYDLAHANEELKNLDRLKTRFFANVSHEVRTPLTSIIAPLQSLRQGDVGAMNLDQSDLLDQMHRNAIRLLDLINQMLDFSKLEAGEAHLRLAMVNLADYTGEIAFLFQEVVSRKGLTIDFEFNGDTEETVFIDKDRYERILTNLIRNGVKFTQEGGLGISLTRKKGFHILKVTDTGIGIPKSQLSHIFERFSQVDATSTRQYEGTGLGLAIVEESVRLMHGTISVESVLNMGTVFTIEIPDNLVEREPEAFVERRLSDRRQDAESGPESNRRNIERRQSDYSRIPVSELALVESQSFRTHGDPENGERPAVDVPETGRHVLVTEDNDDLRHYISRILERMGHRITSAANGEDAWNKLAAENSIDLLVTDIMMPKMDGYELLKLVRGNTKTKDLPVIMITAKAGDDPKLKALGIGADDYLPKPINVRELDARIRNLLTSRDLHIASAQASVLDQRMEELRMSFAQALEIRDAETGNHCREVLDIGSGIAEELGLQIDQTLMDSLLLHDIGKIGIPDEILLKPSSLDDSEYLIMQTHAELGKKLLEGFSNFREVSDIILAHQEHWDGTGYPRGLKGEEIHPIARIIAVADAYHAMTNTRPYRVALKEKEAVDELRKHRGSQFAPDVVDAFMRSRNLD